MSGLGALANRQEGSGARADYLRHDSLCEAVFYYFLLFPLICFF